MTNEPTPEEIQRMLDEAGTKFELDLPVASSPSAPVPGVPVPGVRRPSLVGASRGDRAATYTMDSFFDEQLLRRHDQLDDAVIEEAFLATGSYLRALTGVPSALFYHNVPGRNRGIEDLVSAVVEKPFERYHLSTLIAKQMDRTEASGELVIQRHPFNGDALYVATYKMAPSGIPLATAAVISPAPFVPEQLDDLRTFLGWSDSHLAWALATKLKNDRISTLEEQVRTLEERLAPASDAVAPTVPAASDAAVAATPAPSSHVVETTTLSYTRPATKRDAFGTEVSLVERAGEERYLRQVSAAAAARLGKGRLELFGHSIPSDPQVIYTLLRSVIDWSDAFDKRLLDKHAMMLELQESDGPDGSPLALNINVSAQMRDARVQPVARTLALYRTANYVPKLLSLGFDTIGQVTSGVLDVNALTEAMTKHYDFRQEFPRDHVAYVVALAMNDVSSSGIRHYEHHARALPEGFFSSSEPQRQEAANLIAAVADVQEMKIQFGMRVAESRLGKRFHSTLPGKVHDILDWTITYDGLPRRLFLLRQTSTPRLDKAEDLGVYAKHFTLGELPHFREYLTKLQRR